MGSYMLTSAPGRMNGARLLNSTWVPLMVHRFFGNFVMAGYALAGYAAWQLWRRRGFSDAGLYHVHLFRVGIALGIVSLLLQPFTGLVYALFIQYATPDAYAQVVRGQYQPLLYLQFSLIAGLFIGNHFLVKAAGGSARY